LYADVVADALKLSEIGDTPEFESKNRAFSILESLRLAASETLDMEPDDLQSLLLVRPGEDWVSGLLYDPMPGGSGLLEQIIERWSEVRQAALRLLNCPSACARACTECLMTYRNQYAHRFLDRAAARDFWNRSGSVLQVAHEIPPSMDAPAADPGGTTNAREQRLLQILRDRSFPEPEAQRTIELGGGLCTDADFFYPSSGSNGICVYFDGMSKYIHGNAQSRRRDNTIRESLEDQGYEVIVIASSDLEDEIALAPKLNRLARLLSR
ncbi:MAG TPA: DUF1998 domain-containing protein, partial [Fimbriimonadaceae bacterium]|nr:DUF1998 domain-containing protein [Fimbriimonadaceae bacterium]